MISRKINNYSLAVFGIFVFALVIRIFHIWQLNAEPFFSLLLGDVQSYDEWAQQIAAGNWLGKEVFYQAPLYPYFLGSVYSILSRDIVIVRVCQAVLGALSCVFITDSCRRFFSKKAGIIAGLILAAYAPAIFFDSIIGKSALDLFFLCLMLWLLSKLVMQHTKLLWFLVGLVMGCLGLTRENTLVFIIAIVIWLFFHCRSLGLKGCLVFAGMFFLGLAVTLFPVAMRNQIVGGQFHLTTSQFGPNFYIGNNTNANGTYEPLLYGRGHPKYERLDATRLAEQAMGKKLTPAGVSRYWTGRALDYITSQPADWLRLKVKTFALFWNTTEIADTEDQYTYAEYSMPLRLTGYICQFGVIAPIAFFGVWVTWQKRKELWLLYLMMAIYMASVVMFFVLARFRYLMAPFLILFASVGLTKLRHFLHTNSIFTIASCIITTVAVAVFCNWPMTSRNSQQATMHINIGVALHLQGLPDEAISHFRRALQLKPDEAEAHINMGIALQLQGKFDEALAYFYRVLQMKPDSFAAHFNIGRMFMSQGNVDKAINHFRWALQTKSDSSEVHNQLGIAMGMQGKLNEAINHFHQALQIEPDSAEIYINLGYAMELQGNIDEAINQYRKALRINPDHTKANKRLNTALAKQKDHQ